MTENRSAYSETVALIVTYYPDAGLLERAQATADQVSQVLIVDNGSTGRARDIVASTVRELNANFIANAENQGVGAALNQGVAWARERGFKWVLTLDQDTTLACDAVDELFTALGACPFKHLVAIVGSSMINFPGARPSGRWSEVQSVITSASLLSVDAFEEVGPFREDFFIDYVDVEWCLRSRSRGYRLIAASKPMIVHYIGNPRYHKFLSRTVISTHHRPFRRYYMTRNRIIVWKEYFSRERKYVAGDAMFFLKDAIKLLLYEESRPEQLRNVLAGVRDGLTNRTGKKVEPRAG